MTADFGWRWLDRMAFRSASRHITRTFDAELRLVPAGTVGSVMLAVFSWVLYVFIVALFGFGVWLCTLEFPGPGLFLGLMVIGVAAELRPRFGRVPKFAIEVTAAEAPQLHRLVAQVAAAVGAPVPAVYVEDDEFNASSGAYGLRRRKAVVIGLPLWNALSGQQRVVVLGHELGHFVNGDPRRGLMVQPALTTLGRLAALFAHEKRIERARDNLVGVLAHWAVNAVKAVIRGLLLPPRFLLAVLALRDGQRAEYRADRLAAMVAGRAATVELLDMMTVRESALMLVKRDARAGRSPSGRRRLQAYSPRCGRICRPGARPSWSECPSSPRTRRTACGPNWWRRRRTSRLR